jgi:hypothetical protein
MIIRMVNKMKGYMGKMSNKFKQDTNKLLNKIKEQNSGYKKGIQ